MKYSLLCERWFTELWEDQTGPNSWIQMTKWGPVFLAGSSLFYSIGHGNNMSVIPFNSDTFLHLERDVFMDCIFSPRPMGRRPAQGIFLCTRFPLAGALARRNTLYETPRSFALFLVKQPLSFVLRTSSNGTSSNSPHRY